MKLFNRQYNKTNKKKILKNSVTGQFVSHADVVRAANRALDRYAETFKSLAEYDRREKTTN